METALFDNVIESLTSYDGITQDENGNIFMESNKSINKPSPRTPTKTPDSYRVETVQEAILLGGSNPLDATKSVIKKMANRDIYTADEIYDIWLNAAPADDLNSSAPTNRDHYNLEDTPDARTTFNQQVKNGNLFEVKGGRVSSVGDYNFDSAEERLNYILNSLTSSERSLINDKSKLRKLAWATDWKVSNKKNEGETLNEYVERMKKAYKKEFKKNY